MAPVTPASASDEPGAPEKRLRQALPTALEGLESLYSKIEGSATVIESSDFDLVPEATKAKWKLPAGVAPPRGEHTIAASEVTFSASGDYRKCELIPINRDDIYRIDDSPKSTPPYKMASCVGPRGGFSLKWNTQSDGPQLESFAIDGVKERSSYNTHVNSFLNATYTLPFGKLSRLIQDKDFSLTEVSTVGVEGRSCLRAQFTYRSPSRAKDGSPKASSRVIAGHFVVDPEMSWSLRSWKYSAPGTSRSVSADIRYQVDDTGVNFPSEIMYVGDNVRKRIFSIKDISTTRIKDSDFTLTFYGLPELDKPVGELNDNRIAWWLGGAAVLTLGASALLWLRGRNIPASNDNARR